MTETIVKIFSIIFIVGIFSFMFRYLKSKNTKIINHLQDLSQKTKGHLKKTLFGGVQLIFFYKDREIIIKYIFVKTSLYYGSPEYVPQLCIECKLKSNNKLYLLILRRLKSAFNILLNKSLENLSFEESFRIKGDRQYLTEELKNKLLVSKYLFWVILIKQNKIKIETTQLLKYEELNLLLDVIDTLAKLT